MARADKKQLKKVLERIKPSSFLGYRGFLRSLYEALKQQVGTYSYVSFAEDLGFAATNIIHQYVNGRRPLSMKGAVKMVASLDLKGVEKHYFLNLVALHSARSPAEKDEVFEKLLDLKSRLAPTSIARDMLEYYSRWYHSIIREMVRMENFSSDINWIADHIEPRIRPEQIRESLAVLERLSLIRYDKTAERHIPVEEHMSTGHETTGMAIMNFHSQMIDIGRDALTRVSPERRDFSAVTVCVSEKKARKLKSLIHQFQMELLAEDADCDERAQVYQVNIQLFPFTRRDPE